MTQPNWPPKVYNILTKHVNDNTLPHSTFRLYCKLLALAWGKETLSMQVSDLMTAVSLKRSALFEHAHSLQLHDALRWRCVDDVFECSFLGGDVKESADPRFADSAYIESLTSKTQQNQKNRKVKKESSESADPRFADSPPKATTRQITDEYKRLLGSHVKVDFAAGEGAAAKFIGQHYTVEQFRAAYQHFKRQPFWCGKLLTLRYLKNQIGPYLTESQSAPLPDDDTQLEADLAFMRARGAAKEVTNGAS